MRFLGRTGKFLYYDLESCTVIMRLANRDRGFSMVYVKGQGATEYLVLLAVVLIIALVSIALLGFFPGLATDARITQSNSYWRGEARPFAILEVAIQTNGLATLVVQNNEAQGALTMLNISVGSDFNDTAVSGGLGASGLLFAPGEQHILTLDNVTSGGAVSTGSSYDFPVNISYRTGNGVSSTQYGVKNLIGKYV